MIKYIYRSVCVASLLVILFASTALALTPNPDSSPSLTDMHVHRHLLQPNDYLFTAKYNIPYSTIPDANVAQAFIFRMFAADNVTELAANEAYPYAQSGYGYGIISFYFDNTTAPTWGISYPIQLAGKAGEFVIPPEWNYNIPASAYSTYTDQEGNQTDLAVRLLDIANDLEVDWGITLLTAADTGTVLATNGEIYFRQSIPGLQLMAPDLFLVQIADPDYTERGWATTTADTYATRYTGTWIGNATLGIANLFKLDWHFVLSIPIMIISVLCVVVGAWHNNILSGMMNATASVLYGGIQGWTPLAIIGIGTIMAAAYLGYHWFLKGSQ